MSSIGRPTQTQNLGPFNNVVYMRYRGQFRGASGDLEFSVPYEITVPRNPSEGAPIFVFEPPHVVSGLIARDTLLGPNFLFGNRYSHASVGFGNRGGHVLDPNAPFEIKIKGNLIKPILPDSRETELVDFDIMRQFAAALRRSDSDLFGEVRHIYAVGFSNSGKTVNDIYREFGHKSFDLTMAGTAPYAEPVKIAGQSPVIVLNTEKDFDARAIPKPDFPAYRYYAIAGGPHIPDARQTRQVFTGEPLPAIAGITPINWLPIARALFKAGDKWIRDGKQLPPNATFRLNAGGEIVRDERQNALGGIRHPAVELGEGRFIASVDRNGWDLFGGYRNPRQLTAVEYSAYVRSFKQKTDALFDAGYLLERGRDRLHRHAQLKPNNTYTLNYREGLLYRD